VNSYYPDINVWAEAYIRVHEDRASQDENHPDYLAAYEFMDTLKDEVAERCWQGILTVVEKKPSEWVLGVLAAGPLEDLLEDSGKDYIDLIEIEARKNPSFKKILNGVWESGTKEIWARFEKVRTVKNET